MEKYWHWSDRLADELLELNRDKYVITAGITPSGPVHLGSVCEFLFPEAIYRALRFKSDKEVKMYFIVDVLDALDSITADLQDYSDIINEDMGKPLKLARDPKGEFRSYAERYVNELRYVMSKFKVHLELVEVSDMYDQGLFDKYTLIYLQNIDKVKEIIQNTSGRELPKDWNPVMPICSKCNRIDSTRVISYDAITGDYEYICNNCGNTERTNIKEHRYKLQWRLHWPSWQAIMNSDIEGGGVDHFTKGGSRDTAVKIHTEILGRNPPIGYKYGFVLLDGKKYSKSKGIGMYVRDMIELIPAEIIAYHLLKYDLEENIDFNPTKEKILGMIEDFEDAAKIMPSDNLTRGDRKRYSAFRLFGRHPKVAFKEMLLYYSIYRDWNRVKIHIPIDEYYTGFIENWYKRGFVPDDYDFGYKPKKIDRFRDLVESWNPNMSPLDIHNSVYDYAQKKGVAANEIFKYLYNHLIAKDRGPRLGKLVYALGVERVKSDIL
ncbi:MAG: lysine--tRNA ligase [Candidatus Anstonellales archaeon]